MKSGNIVAFKGTSNTFKVLSFLLSIFDSDWRKLKWKPWHLGIAWHKTSGGWWVLAAGEDGVGLKFYFSRELEEVRWYDWLEKPLTQKKLDKFLKGHIGKKYDIATYFWTSLAVIFRHFWNRPIPKLLDDRFSCWELVQEFAEEMGKPIVSKYDVIIIVDIIKALKGGA